jgi:hypothetical protein
VAGSSEALAVARNLQQRIRGKYDPVLRPARSGKLLRPAAGAVDAARLRRVALVDGPAINFRSNSYVVVTQPRVNPIFCGFLFAALSLTLLNVSRKTPRLPNRRRSYGCIRSLAAALPYRSGELKPPTILVATVDASAILIADEAVTLRQRFSPRSDIPRTLAATHLHALCK